MAESISYEASGVSGTPDTGSDEDALSTLQRNEEVDSSSETSTDDSSSASDLSDDEAWMELARNAFQQIKNVSRGRDVPSTLQSARVDPYLRTLQVPTLQTESRLRYLARSRFERNVSVNSSIPSFNDQEARRRRELEAAERCLEEEELSRPLELADGEVLSHEEIARRVSARRRRAVENLKRQASFQPEIVTIRRSEPEWQRRLYDENAAKRMERKQELAAAAEALIIAQQLREEQRCTFTPKLTKNPMFQVRKRGQQGACEALYKKGVKLQQSKRTMEKNAPNRPRTPPKPSQKWATAAQNRLYRDTRGKHCQHHALVNVSTCSIHKGKKPNPDTFDRLYRQNEERTLQRDQLQADGLPSFTPRLSDIRQGYL